MVFIKKVKKQKLKKLDFYIVSDDYIKYLSRYEKHIAYNKNNNRPYVGIVLEVKNNFYFAPMFSPKLQHKSYKNNYSFFKIKDNRTKDYLGLIRFSDMIPVPQNVVYPLDISSKSYGYKRLLHRQYSIINRKDNKEQIYEKANNIYTIVTSTKSQSKQALFYREISCNYKLLEEKSLEYTLCDN